MGVRGVKKGIPIFCLLLFLSVKSAYFSNLNLRKNSSFLTVNPGANFIVDQPIFGVKGTIKKDSNATIEGNNIDFEDGIFQDVKTKVGISGIVAAGVENKITLDGNKKFEGKLGKVLQSIDVGGKGNLLAGSFILSDDVNLLDGNSNLSVDLYSKLTSNLKLNGGSLVLLHDLSFIDYKRIVGPGKIYLNGNKLTFGAAEQTFEENLEFYQANDILLDGNKNLDAIWAFNGANNTINGNGNFLKFKDDGKIIINRGASLLIKDIELRKIQEHSIFCMDDAATISFQNVTWKQQSNYTFSIGHFDVLENFVLKVKQNDRFTYNSPRVSTILSDGMLYLDNKTTFSYDPPSADKNLIAFENNNSILFLDRATLHATVTGMQLTKGTMFVDCTSYLSSERHGRVDNGITLGNDSSDDDFICEFLGDAKVIVSRGSIFYRNINSSSWIMDNSDSVLRLNSKTKLGLYQDLDLGIGRIDCHGIVEIAFASGKKIIGGINSTGRVFFSDL